MKSKKKYIKDKDNQSENLQEPVIEYTSSCSTSVESPVQYTPEELKQRAISAIEQMKEGKFTSHADMVNCIWKLNG